MVRNAATPPVSNHESPDARSGFDRPEIGKPTLGEAPAPLADRFGINSQAGRYDLALLTFSTRQNDPCPQRQGLRCASARRQRRQLSALNLIQPQPSKASTHRQSSQKQESQL